MVEPEQGPRREAVKSNLGALALGASEDTRRKRNLGALVPGASDDSREKTNILGALAFGAPDEARGKRNLGALELEATRLRGIDDSRRTKVEGNCETK